MRILSLQSQVAYGHVGNSAAALPLGMLGHEVLAVPTAVLSNHAGYPDTGSCVLAPDEIGDLVEGLERRGVFAGCGLVLSGYLGNAGTAGIVADAVARVRAVNPAARYCCDPVMGDRGSGVYVEPALTRAFADLLLLLADILTPNLFELEILCAAEDGALDGASVATIVDAARHCLERMRGQSCVLVTSAAHADRSPGMEAVIAVDRTDAWLLETPHLPFTEQPHGAGDLLAALFAARLTQSGDPKDALEGAGAQLHAVLAETARRDLAELAIVESRGVFAQEPERVPARRVD